MAVKRYNKQLFMYSLFWKYRQYAQYTIYTITYTQFAIIIGGTYMKGWLHILHK